MNTPRDSGFGEQSLPKANNLSLPGWVLHEDNSRTVLTNDLACITETKSKDCTQKREDNEADVSSIADYTVVNRVDILTKRYLVSC